MKLINSLKTKLNTWWQDEENKLIGAVLFSESINGQVLLFEKFGVCTQNNLSLKSDITNHYVEENYWINDHWAINPPQYTISGLVGELIYTVPNTWARKVESTFNETGIGLLSVISPTLGSYTSSVLNVTRKIQSVVNKYTSIVTKNANKVKSFFKKNILTKTNQRRVVDELEMLMNNRVLVSVFTPYGTYTNLAISSINVRQGQETKTVSEIEITFQKWRNVGEFYSDLSNEKQTADIAAAQKAKEQNKGLVGTIQSKITAETLRKQSRNLAIEGTIV